MTSAIVGRASYDAIKESYWKRFSSKLLPKCNVFEDGSQLVVWRHANRGPLRALPMGMWRQQAAELCMG
jgi:hypothetical protein